MGAFASRRNAGVEEVDISTSNAYRYPPKSGCYFGSYFIMGGERFDTTQPEAYLFGENQDLNFLGNRPIPFPYPAPQANEPTKTLKSLVNIRKDSLRFIRIPGEDHHKEEKPEGEQEEEEEEKEEDSEEKEKASPRYNIEFTFDTDVRVAITIYYFATEEISNGQAIYHPRDMTMNSETYHYKRGANQTFSQSTHIVEPSTFPEDDWQYNPDKDTIPVVIQCVVEDEAEHTGHSHMTFAAVDRWSNDNYVLKPLKQKQMVDGLCYLLQEIYGIENKNADRTKFQDDEIEDSGSECVICMSDVRDTLILPCRHLCLCNGCADNLRYQANNCPICRAPFRALLQIRAMRKKLPNAPAHLPQSEAEDNGVSQEGVPPGYEAVSLIEALNGPNSLQAPTLQMAPDGVPPVRPTGPSLPTSPEESPILDRRKAKRHSSIRSNHSVREAPVVEEAEEAVENGSSTDPGTNGRETPEVIMTGIAAEPVKSPAAVKAPSRVPIVRFSGGKPATTPESSPDGFDPAQKQSVEIINEVEREQAGVGATAAVPEVAVLPVEGARHITPPPNYEQANDMPTVALPPGVEFQAAAHTVVLSDKAGDGEESVPLCQALPTENMSLPGTPISTTDGSSYSSTSSTRVLLPTGIPPKAPDDNSTA